MAAKIFGKVKVKANGQTFLTKKGSTIDPGGVKRETKNGANQVAGFSEEIVNSKVECEIYVTAGTPLGDLVDVVVEYQTDVGRTFIIPQAWRTDPITLNETDGTAKLVLEGLPAEELS